MNRTAVYPHQKQPNSISLAGGCQWYHEPFKLDAGSATSAGIAIGDGFNHPFLVVCFSLFFFGGGRGGGGRGGGRGGGGGPGGIAPECSLLAGNMLGGMRKLRGRLLNWTLGAQVSRFKGSYKRQYPSSSVPVACVSGNMVLLFCWSIL